MCERDRARAGLSRHSVTPTFMQTHSSCPVNIQMNDVATVFGYNFGNSYTKLQFKKFPTSPPIFWFQIGNQRRWGKKTSKIL